MIVERVSVFDWVRWKRRISLGREYREQKIILLKSICWSCICDPEYLLSVIQSTYVVVSLSQT